MFFLIDFFKQMWQRFDAASFYVFRTMRDFLFYHVPERVMVHLLQFLLFLFIFHKFIWKKYFVTQMTTKPELDKLLATKTQTIYNKSGIKTFFLILAIFLLALLVLHQYHYI